ncbi:hypothetical protein M514_11768 [Trichuris suis]|uniref:PDZ domain-containing protein n=1 Tax=Trichuris suis TaxID=68888 RepID=A0A085MVR8_9BILA|nr:hypothetical protein M514_11768 [Trichuris suis]
MRCERSLFSCTLPGISTSRAMHKLSTMLRSMLLSFYFTLLIAGTAGETNTCKRHADCVGQEICLQGKCIDARPTNTHCLNDQGCPKNQGCKLNRCWEEETSRRYCKAHKDCQLQELCDHGYCIDAQPTHRICAAQRDCEAKEACRGKICWVPSSRKHVTVKSCSSYRDCTGSSICLHSRCVQGEGTGRRCVDNNSCYVGEECVQGICWRSKSLAPCTKHDDCHPSMFCYDETCREGKATGYPCQESSDCKGKQSCKENECWSLLEREQCNSHEDCAIKELCIDDICIIAEPTKERCLTDDNCPLRQACKRNQCWKPVDIQRSCMTHDDCYDYDVCIGDRCTTGFPTDRKCITDRSCENNEICRRDYCVKITGTQGTKCLAHEDCDEDMLCQRKRCREALPTQMECSRDSECANGGCKFNICWEYAGKPIVEGRCSVHDHCDAEKLCHKGVCVVPESTSDTCTTDLECKSTDRCKLNLCWRLQGTADFCTAFQKLQAPYEFPFVVTSCTRHNDCGDYSVCHESTCYLARPTKHLCYNDYDCALLNGGCRFGVCWSRLTTCKEHRECSGQDICYNGFCRTAEPSGNDCGFEEGEEQCKAKEMCRHNICWKLSTRHLCRNDEDCDEYSICEDRQCVTLRPVDGSCATSGPMGSCPANRVFRSAAESGANYVVGHFFTDMFGHEVPFYDTLGFVVCVCLYALKSYMRGGILVRGAESPSDFNTTTLWKGENVTWMEKWLDAEDYPAYVGCYFQAFDGTKVTKNLTVQIENLEGPCYHDGHEKFALQQCQPGQYCVRRKNNEPVCQQKPIGNRTNCNTSIFFPSLCELMNPNCWMNASCISNVSLSAYQDPDQVLPLGTYIKWPVTDSVRFTYYANQEVGKDVYVSLTCLERGEDRGSTKFEYEVRTFQPDEFSVAAGDVSFNICFDSELFRIVRRHHLRFVPKYLISLSAFDVTMEADGKELLESTPENPIHSVKCRIDSQYMITDLFHVQTWWSVSSTGKDLKTDVINGDEHVSSNYRCNVMVKFQPTFPRMEMEEYKHRELRIYLSGSRNVDFNKTIALERYNKRRPRKDEEDMFTSDVLLAIIMASSGVFGLGCLCFVNWYAGSVRKTKVKLGKLRKKPRIGGKRKGAAGWAPHLIRETPSIPSRDEEESSEPLLQGEQSMEEIKIALEDLDLDQSESTETRSDIETGTETRTYTETEEAGIQFDEEEEDNEETTEEPANQYRHALSKEEWHSHLAWNKDDISSAIDGDISSPELAALQKILKSEFFNCVREVYEHVYETVDIQGSPEARAMATAKATVAAFAAAEGYAHPRVVELPKTDEGLGFNVMGGKEQNSPIFISRIIPGGVADRNGALRRGDQLINVNGINVEGESHEKAVDLLKGASGSVKLLVRYTPRILEEVERRFDHQRVAATCTMHSESCSDIKLVDFSNALSPFNGSKKTQKRLKKLKARSVRETLNWYELDDRHFSDLTRESADDCFDEEAPRWDGLHSQKLECDAVQSAESYRSYPADLWHLIAQFIKPEDVCTFALLCRDTAAVVRSAHFWKGIYNRYCAGSSALPDRLNTIVVDFCLIDNIVALFLSNEVITKLKRCVCISAWQNRSVDVSPREVQWTYYFRLLMNGRAKQSGRFANRKQTKSKFNRLKFLDDVNANADEGQLILKIVSSSYAFIPNTVLGGRLINVSTLLGSGLSSTCMCLSFTGTAVVGSKSDGTPVGSYCPTSIVISDVTATFAYDWWHSAFPSTPLTIQSLETTYHH